LRESMPRNPPDRRRLSYYTRETRRDDCSRALSQYHRRTMWRAKTAHRDDNVQLMSPFRPSRWTDSSTGNCRPRWRIEALHYSLVVVLICSIFQYVHLLLRSERHIKIQDEEQISPLRTYPFPDFLTVFFLNLHRPNVDKFQEINIRFVCSD